MKKEVFLSILTIFFIIIYFELPIVKEKILTEVGKIKAKNIEEKKLDQKISKSVNYMNPIYRQKGIGEFIDITRNGRKS